MPDVRQVNPNLVLSPRPRPDSQQRKFSLRPLEALGHREVGLRCAAVRAHAILDRHPARLVAAKRLVDGAGVRPDVAVNNRVVRLPHTAAFPKPPQFLRRLVVLGQQHDAGCLTVKPVDHMHRRRLAKVQPRAADQAAHLVALGWVANQIGRLVDHQQLVVLVDDLEQLVGHAAARPGLRTSRNSQMVQPEPTDNKPSTEKPTSHGVLKSSRPE